MEAIAAAQTSASPALPVLIGREHETKLLVQALGDGSALVLVEGDDGAGKTTLVPTAPAGDARPLLAGRPAKRLARTLFVEFPGEGPAGALPPAWLPTAGD